MYQTWVLILLLRKKCFCKTSFQLRMDLKEYRNKAEMEKRKKITRHLLCIFCRCRVVYYYSYSPSYFLLLLNHLKLFVMIAFSIKLCFVMGEKQRYVSKQ